MTEVICDAGPLIHLDELGCANLLNDFASVLVPQQVLREVERHRPTIQVGELRTASVIGVTVALTPDFEVLVRTLALGAGEQAALSLALTRGDALMLSDDAAARLAAKALGVRAYGTLGVLLRAIRRRQRSRQQVLEVLRSLQARSTLHVSRDLLRQVIEEVESH